jgi:hypothetical protein
LPCCHTLLHLQVPLWPLLLHFACYFALFVAPHLGVTRL